MLAPAQVEVGIRAQRDDWSVADEHAATAITEVVLSVLALRQPAPTPRPAPICVTTPSGEWHGLAARMVAEGLRARRWDAIFLGTDLPDDHLGRFLHRLRFRGSPARSTSPSTPASRPSSAGPPAARTNAGHAPSGRTRGRGIPRRPMRCSVGGSTRASLPFPRSAPASRRTTSISSAGAARWWTGWRLGRRDRSRRPGPAPGRDRRSGRSVPNWWTRWRRACSWTTHYCSTNTSTGWSTCWTLGGTSPDATCALLDVLQAALIDIPRAERFTAISKGSRSA
jgi:hypothetical protein